MLEKCCGREQCNINAKCDYKLQFEECMKLTELIEFKIAVVVLWEYKNATNLFGQNDYVVQGIFHFQHRRNKTIQF